MFNFLLNSFIYLSSSSRSIGFGAALTPVSTVGTMGLTAVLTGDGAGTTGTGCGDIATVARARAGCQGGWTGALGGGVGDRTISACER